MYEDYNQPNYEHYGTNGGTYGSSYGSGYSSYEMPKGGTGGGPKKKKGGFFKKTVTLVLSGVLFGGAAAGTFAVVDRAADRYFPQENVSSVQAAGTERQPVVTTTASTQTITSDVSGVVKNVMPSVVSITTLTREEVMSFWGQTFAQENEYSGSGIIVGESDTELLIATNNHVVEGAEKLTVQFVDDELVEAQLKGSAGDVDLAVIAVPLSSIKASTLEQIKVATLGDSDVLQVGEPVIAIGNALGYGQSVTTGVVSALERELTVDGMTYHLLQTDAAINPGNSGGALVNANGEVIGINSAKLGALQIEGIGYAIPISSVKDIISDLMNRDTKYKVSETERGYLGIGMNSTMDITSELASYYNLPQGVYVGKVYENTGAAAAGIQEGDVITAVNGEAVTSSAELQKQLQYYSAGTSIKVSVQRASEQGYGYEEMTFTVTLGSKPE